MDNNKFPEFRKLLIDSGKTFDSCVAATGMSRSGLRRALENQKMDRDKIVTLAKHLGYTEDVMAEAISPQEAPLPSPKFISNPSTPGELLDYLLANKAALVEMIEKRRK